MTAEQPRLRDILRAINRVIAGDKAPLSVKSAETGSPEVGSPGIGGPGIGGPGIGSPGIGSPGIGSPETSQKIPGITPIVAKLTTPLGKPQRNNFLVMALLALDVVLGATFGLVGYVGLQSDSIALTGAVMATAGLLLMLLYQLFGRER